MKHVMLDAYGAEENQVNNITHINQLLNDLAYALNLEPIAPPTLIPYYYGSVKEDVGITSFMLLKGGHITIHTFPLRECYFVDCVSPKDFDTDAFYHFLYEKLHFTRKKSIYQVADRLTEKREIKEYKPECDFGPHYMARIKALKTPTMEDIFGFLETVVDNINMDKITRATVLLDNYFNPSYISGIIIIAQSHISIHYSIKENRYFVDCFSCAPFDFTTLNTEFSKLGEIRSCELIPRGTKHIAKIKNKPADEYYKASSFWQKNAGR